MMQQTARSGEKAPLFGGRKPLFTQSQLLKLTWPLLVEQFLAVTVGMADTMMVSRCGEAAISGVSLVDMINNLIIVLFSALATGGAVVVSQFHATIFIEHCCRSYGKYAMFIKHFVLNTLYGCQDTSPVLNIRKLMKLPPSSEKLVIPF